MSYVLRKDGWRDEDGPIKNLIKGKSKYMRRYLKEQKRVFVNNISQSHCRAKPILMSQALARMLITPNSMKVQPVMLSIPLESNMIGPIDGQHRVFCYHESSRDPLDVEISKQRTRQNLLVTGLIYPEDWEQSKRSIRSKVVSRNIASSR